MSAIDDMTEKRLHDLTEDHEFSIVEASAPSLADEFPFRGPDMPMDYRQPGFAFSSPARNVFVCPWKSFVQGVLCAVPERFTAPDGFVLGVRASVTWRFEADDNPPAPGVEPTTRKYATGPFSLNGVDFFCAGELPEAKSIPYDGSYDSNNTDHFGNKFEDTEIIVCMIGVVVDGVLERQIEQGNLFLSRGSRNSATTLVVN